MLSDVIENKATFQGSRAHNLLVDLQNLDAEIVTLANIVSEARTQESDDLNAETMEDLLKYLDEKHRFLEAMIRRLIVAGASIIKQSYDWQFRFTLDSVNDITKRG